MSKKHTYTLQEISITTGIDEELILIYIKEEWIVPPSPETNLFDEEDLARLWLIRELQNDLGVNSEAVPIILHLIDQIHGLHRQIKNKVRD